MFAQDIGLFSFLVGGGKSAETPKQYAENAQAKHPKQKHSDSRLSSFSLYVFCVNEHANFRVFRVNTEKRWTLKRA